MVLSDGKCEVSGKRHKKNKAFTGAARVLAAVAVILSILSIQQVWAEEFCTCDHQNPSAAAGAHCTKHATQDEHSEEAHCAAAEQQTTRAEHSGAAQSLSSHHHAAQSQQREETESVATSAPRHDNSDQEQGSGNSIAARLDPGANCPSSDGNSTPAKLDCCHILPAANLPAASIAVYSADLATDSAPVVFDSAPATTVIPATVFHPPPSRPIYVKVSSFLI